MLKLGEFNDFIVKRKSDLGYVLEKDDEEIFLHQKQACGVVLNPGDMISAFLLKDSQNRLCATLEDVKITLNKFALLDVVSVKENVGVFVSINVFKDILVEADELPRDFSIWPQLGDKLLVRLVLKKGRLAGKLLKKDEMKTLNNNFKNYELGQSYQAYVTYYSDKAVNLITDDFVHVYVPVKNFKEKYHLGELVNILIIGFHDDELVASLNKIKEEEVLDDEVLILDYLKKHNGKMNITAKTDSETIEKEFHLSRKAFKRALGSLYKQQKIKCLDNETILL